MNSMLSDNRSRMRKSLSLVKLLLTYRTVISTKDVDLEKTTSCIAVQILQILVRTLILQGLPFKIGKAIA